MSPLQDHWSLEPDLAFLNHGSFGACPRPVLEYQQGLRSELEREPVSFFVRGYGERWDEARSAVAAFVGADPAGVVVLPNATTGVATVLGSLEPELRAGDELLTTDHGYNACRNALAAVAERTGARVVTVPLPFPISGPDEVVDRVCERVGPRTRLALLDHVTSPTGLVLPLAELVPRLDRAGVDTLVDGAHGPGMVPLDLEALGAAYYTGNGHKWLCGPKSSAFLSIRSDRRDRIRPLVTSHGRNIRRPGRSRLHDEFDWTGTTDPTPFLALPRAIEWVGGLLPGGWPAIMKRNRELALRARDLLCDALGLEAPAPDGMIGTLVALPIPDGPDGTPRQSSTVDSLQEALYHEDRIEVLVLPWPAPPHRLVRLSVHLYNELEEYRGLAGVLERRLR